MWWCRRHVQMNWRNMQEYRKCRACFILFASGCQETLLRAGATYHKFKGNNNHLTSFYNVVVRSKSNKSVSRRTMLPNSMFSCLEAVCMELGNWPAQFFGQMCTRNLETPHLLLFEFNAHKFNSRIWNQTGPTLTYESLKLAAIHQLMVNLNSKVWNLSSKPWTAAGEEAAGHAGLGGRSRTCFEE